MAGLAWVRTGLCVVLCAAWLLSVTAHEECAIRRATPKISVEARRNRTGHWISQISFQYRDGVEPSTEFAEGNQWKTEVESTVARCPDAESKMDVTLTLTATPLRAGPGYELWPGVGYYKFHTKAETWPRAREICAKEGGHLAIINSEPEAEVLVKIFARQPRIEGAGHENWAWIGAYEGIQGGQYFTIFGDPVNDTGFARWGPGQPNVVGTQAYLHVHKETGGLGDTTRNVKDGFFCEQELF